MKGILLKACFCLVLTVSSFCLYAQRFDSLLNILNTGYPQEKLYLQFDRDLYNPGETIWFKAYLFAGNYPSMISRTLYAELLDQNGKVLQRRTAPVVESSAAAAFDLPQDMKDPIVYVRAYTRWMLNFDSSFLFVKPIRILTGKPAPAVADKGPQYFLELFPEGGDLVDGVTSRVAFKGTDRRGMPIPVSGQVKDSKGKEVTTFSSVHDGMGTFSLSPEEGEKYTASWKDEKGKVHETVLPDALKTGVTLEVKNLGENLLFVLKRSGEVPKNMESVYVVAQMNQQLLYRARGNLTASTMTSGYIPVKNLPAGIVQITVFSLDEKPLAERIAFLKPWDYSFITDLNTPLKDMGKRKKNVIQIDVPDTIRCNLSIAVTDASANPRPTEDENNIYSSVLLTSDIKGYVHNPAYYFSEETDSVTDNLDLVMMTNGWRRFNWENVLAGKWPDLKYLPEDYLAIEGKIIGLKQTELLQKELTGILQTKDGSSQFLSIPVEPNGQFKLGGMLFFDTAKIFYQFNNDKNKMLTTRAGFEFGSNLLKIPPTVKPDSLWAYRMIKPDEVTLASNKAIADKQRELFDQQKKVQTLATVEVTAQKKTKAQKMDEEYTSGLFSGGDGYTFITEDDPLANASQSVFQYLQGRVAGLQITTSGSMGQPTLSWRGGTPSLFLDEMQSDAQMLQNIPMTDVAMVKVFRPPFFGGAGGGSGGAIAVYTKKGSAANDNVKGLDFAELPGYTPVKQFYSPDYSKYDSRNEQPDYRTTLYWNPFVLTDKDNRRIILEFYNNDVTNKMRVVIEGCNVNGQLTRIEKVFE